MVELTLVRHGQANTGASDEKSYDRLSDLGRQQARWLGEHFANVGTAFDHVISGTLHRQFDTATEITGVIGGKVDQDARLNEIAYFDLANDLKAKRGIPVPTTQEAFVPHIPIGLRAWEDGEISAGGEAYSDFAVRTQDMLKHAETLSGRVLFVTSGGIIAAMMRHVLGLDTIQKAEFLLQTRNSSVHKLRLARGELRLDVFNAIPHLEHADRAYARTYT